MSTTAAISGKNLLSLIRQHGVIDEARLEDFLRQQPEGLKSGPDARPLAEALVAAKLLTQFQANLLLTGKTRALRVAKKYRLVDRIGSGGMGVVFLCEHILMKRLVALKVLPVNLVKEPGNLERFQREAQAVAALKHPNIVQAFDVDTDENGLHYLVMEFIDGVNLDKLVGRHGPLDPVRAAHYIAQAADGLHHAAQRGMVHRDIKPSNLLLDREGTVKILDMGLARFFDSRSGGITERFDGNAIIGTADYISPEQALDSKEVDSRADIYSLGCTFYYLLTGKAPFADANVTQKLLLHQMREPPPIRDSRPEVDEELVAVVARMMAKDRAHRYQTAGEVVEALAPWTDEPIDPPRPEEMPGTAWPGESDKAGTASGISARTTVSAPSSRRPRAAATQVFLPVTIGEEEKQPLSWKQLAVKAGALAAGLGVLALAIARPWESEKTTPELGRVKDGGARAIQAAQAPNQPAAPELPPGFVHVKIDPGVPRPAVRPDGVRASDTDLLLITGSEMNRDTEAERALLESLRKKQVGGAGGPRSQTMPIVPFAVGIDGGPVPNTLVSAGQAGSGLHALIRDDSEYVTNAYLAGVKPDANVLLRGNLTLPAGLTTVNALVAEPRDIAAAPGGSTVRVAGGALLVAGNSEERNFSLGSGGQPLTIDFNGRTGYLTLSSDQDWYTLGGGREYTVRARLANTGSGPLVLSGVSGTVLRLDTPDNTAPSLAVQGLTLAVQGKPFRVLFTRDEQLGAARGAIRLSDASLRFAGKGELAIERPLLLQPTGTANLAVADRGSVLKWAGKVGGNRLSKSGDGTLLLASRENDYGGGTEVFEGELRLDGEFGTPSGRGGVTVMRGATLSGVARVHGPLHIQSGAFLRPGSDAGRPLHVPSSLRMDEDSTLELRIPNPDARLLYYSGYGTVHLSGVKLSFRFAEGYEPKPTDRCFPVTGSQPWNGTFRGAAQNATVTSADGRWVAKIGYTGNAGKGTLTGGKDIVLFDFAPAQRKQ